MKNTIFVSLAALLFSAAANAQSTVDSIAAKYHLLPMPGELTIEKTFPALGTYQLNTAEGATQQVTISLDQENKGIVWVEGFPQGKFKAYLKQSPATYRVIAQKTESGKQIPEGTLIYDPAVNTLNMALGKPFDAANPASVFSLSGAPAYLASSGSSEMKVKSKSGASKSKTRIQFFSASKAEAGSVSSTTPANTTNPVVTQ